MKNKKLVNLIIIALIIALIITAVIIKNTQANSSESNMAINDEIVNEIQKTNEIQDTTEKESGETNIIQEENVLENNEETPPEQGNITEKNIAIPKEEPILGLIRNENKELAEENAMIIEEVLKQRIQGIKNEVGVYVTPAFPKLIYVLDEYNCLKGGKYDYLTKLAVKYLAQWDAEVS